jgi:hypothetical protein
MALHLDLTRLPAHEPLWVNVLRWGFVIAVAERNRPYSIAFYCNPMADCGFGRGTVSVLVPGGAWGHLVAPDDFASAQDCGMWLSETSVLAARIAETCGEGDEWQMTPGVVLGTISCGQSRTELIVRERDKTCIAIQTGEIADEWSIRDLVKPPAGRCLRRTKSGDFDGDVETLPDVLSCFSDAEVFYGATT